MTVTTSVSASTKRCCVLDPALALTPLGLEIARRLSPHLELWIGRELWHILENVQSYIQSPALLVADASSATPAELEQLQYTLRNWENFMAMTERGKSGFYWFGDTLWDSQLPVSRSKHTFRQWEYLSHWLDKTGLTDDQPMNILKLGSQDAVALAASLESAFILTFRNVQANHPNLPPAICSTLMGQGLNCQGIDRPDSLVEMEKNQLKQLLVLSSLAKFCWSGLHLAVVHLVIPTLTAAEPSLPAPLSSDHWSNHPYPLNPWSSGTAFWYDMMGG
jgi:hypothetical protein